MVLLIASCSSSSSSDGGNTDSTMQSVTSQGCLLEGTTTPLQCSGVGNSFYVGLIPDGSTSPYDSKTNGAFFVVEPWSNYDGGGTPASGTCGGKDDLGCPTGWSCHTIVGSASSTTVTFGTCK